MEAYSVKPYGIVCLEMDQRRFNEGANMKGTSLLIVGLLVLTGCEFIGDVFEAGVWVGVLLVLGIIALIVWLIFGRKSN